MFDLSKPRRASARALERANFSTSGSLRRPDDALSVDLSSLCTAAQTQERANATFHVAAFTAAAARAAECVVTRNPVPGNDAHALVWGDNPDNGSSSKGQTRQIARAALIVLIGS